jgi:hypothetical protein
LPLDDFFIRYRSDAVNENRRIILKKTTRAKTSPKRAGRPRESAGGAVVFAGSIPAELAQLVEDKRRREDLSRSAALRAALEAWLT